MNIDPTIAYDIVQLPSHGIYYPDKRKTLKVAYLTAADENILTSPNLVRNNLAIDELIKRKVLDKDFDVELLSEEDKQSILIFLRNTAYGSEYKIMVTDPVTGKEFEVNIDLSVLKLKDFNLVPNNKGEFEYYLEKCKKHITFKFLTSKEEKELDNFKDNYTDNVVVPYMTKRLEKMIKSVDGNVDPMAIYQFIQRMPIKDSQDFKKFVSENKPGLNLTQEVIAPSGEKVIARIDFGVEFFRPFFGV